MWKADETRKDIKNILISNLIINKKIIWIFNSNLNLVPQIVINMIFGQKIKIHNLYKCYAESEILEVNYGVYHQRFEINYLKNHWRLKNIYLFLYIFFQNDL